MKDKWERLYKAEGGPPWCSGKASTHLASFLRTGSVIGGSSGGTGASVSRSPTAAAAASAPLPAPPPAHRRRQINMGDALDLGCGSNGANVALLASRGYRAAGVDFVLEAVGRARQRATAEASAAAHEEGEEEGAAAVAFAACDAMTARLTCWDDVRRVEEAETRRRPGPLPAEEGDEDEGPSASLSAATALAALAAEGRFALVFDCQTWQVLRLEFGDEGHVVARYRRLLQTGGVLILLCGRPQGDDGGGEGEGAGGTGSSSADDGRRSDGPNEVSLAELRRAFSRERGWREREIVATQFDPTPAYERRTGGPPLGWAAVFEAVAVGVGGDDDDGAGGRVTGRTSKGAAPPLDTVPCKS